MTLTQVRIVNSSIGASLNAFQTLCLSRMDGHAFFNKTGVPFLGISAAILGQSLSLVTDYIKLGLGLYEMVKLRNQMMKRLISLSFEVTQTTLKTLVDLTLIKLIYLSASILPILMICASTLRLMFNTYNLIDTFIHGLPDTLDRKTQLNRYKSMVSEIMSIVGLTSLCVIFFTGLEPAVLFAMGIIAATNLLFGTTLINFLEAQINKKTAQTLPLLQKKVRLNPRFKENTKLPVNSSVAGNGFSFLSKNVIYHH